MTQDEETKLRELISDWRLATDKLPMREDAAYNDCADDFEKLLAELNPDQEA